MLQIHNYFGVLPFFFFFLFFKAINSIVSSGDLLILMLFKNVSAFTQMLDISVLLTHLVLR